MSRESDEYERFVQEVIKELSQPDIGVYHHKVYRGRVSKRDIKVDVSFNQSLIGGANLLILVECKKYKHAVPVADVEEFHSKIDDIGAHKGIMVTTVGYQDGTIKTAKGRGIALALLTKKRQKGELTFVVNTGQSSPIPENDELWQGNLITPSSDNDAGYRFDGVHQFLSFLFMDEFKGINASNPS